MHRLEQLLCYAFVIIFIIAQLIIVATAKLTWAEYTTVYLQDSCRCRSTIPSTPCPPFTVDPHPDRSAGFIFLSRDPLSSSSFSSSIVHREELHCLLTIRSPPRMQVHVQLESVDLPMVSGTCRAAILQIYDGSSVDDLKQQLVGVCGSALPHQRGFSSTGSELTLSYRQGPEAVGGNKSFNVTFTYFTTRKSGCRETEFRCIGGHFGCVSAQLTCDGVDNCGDASDESSDYNACGKYSPSSNPAVGGSVGVLVVLAVFGLLVGLGLYGANKRTQTRATSCLQLPVSEATNQMSASSADVIRTSPEMNNAQGRRRSIDGMTNNSTSSSVSSTPLPRHLLPQVGSPLQGVVVDDSTATVTTYRIVHVTPNPQRRQIQLTVVPCNTHLLSPPGELSGSAAAAALRTSPPPPYESLFPCGDQTEAVNGGQSGNLG